MNSREILEQTGAPEALESFEVKTARIPTARETSSTLTDKLEPIAAITFEEAMSDYPDFLKGLRVDELSIETAIESVRNGFYDGDPYQRALILDALGHAVRSRKLNDRHRFDEALPQVDVNPNLQPEAGRSHLPVELNEGTSLSLAGI